VKERGWDDGKYLCAWDDGKYLYAWDDGEDIYVSNGYIVSALCMALHALAVALGTREIAGQLAGWLEWVDLLALFNTCAGCRAAWRSEAVREEVLGRIMRGYAWALRHCEREHVRWVEIGLADVDLLCRCSLLSESGELTVGSHFTQSASGPIYCARPVCTRDSVSDPAGRLYEHQAGYLMPCPLEVRPAVAGTRAQLLVGL